MSLAITPDSRKHPPVLGFQPAAVENKIEKVTGSIAEKVLDTHYLQRPRLQTQHLGERLLCYRPIRNGMPNISITTDGDKTIVHNYGHGGSGWTLAPGCVQYLVQQFNATAKAQKDAPLVIIGAGVMGLLTAYMLHQIGYQNITLLAEQFDNLTSHKAGGFCAPTHVTADSTVRERIHIFGIDSYRFYAAIARKENKDFDPQGARLIPVYVMRDEQRLQAYEGVVMNTPQDVIVDFSNGKRHPMKVYDDAIFMDTQRLMNSLLSFLQDKITLQQKRVESFDEIKTPFIFNCAGLGARTLNHDVTVTSAQGHQILLQQQPEGLNYMIGFQAGEGVTAYQQPVRLSVSLFPKQTLGAPATSIGILGGTYIEGADETTPNNEEFDRLIERARDFFGDSP